MRYLLLVVAGATALCTSIPARADAQNVVNVVIVVNATNPMTELSKNELSNIFLKKVTQWSGGSPIVPVDQARSTNVCKEFSRWVHGRSVSMIATYWQTQIFSGNNVPPITRANDAGVLAFVSANQNAIGYVSAAAVLIAGVKAVAVRER